MELYFKDLISEENSLEKLVDDLSLVVHGADDFANAVGASLSPHSRKEIASRLQQLKIRCRHLKGRAVASARATDKALRRHPYSGLGIAFAVGLLAGAVFCRRR